MVPSLLAMGIAAVLQVQPASPAQIVDEALSAHAAAAVAQFEKDGREDRGTCGLYALAVDGRSKVARELLNRKLGYKSEGVSVSFRLPDDVQTQHIAVHAAAGEAARDVFLRHNVKIVRAHAWVD